MPRIPQLPNFSGAVAGSDELPLYDASTDRTYGATMAEVGAYVSSILLPPVTTITGTTHAPAVGSTVQYFVCTNASGCAVTIPTNATQAFPIGSALTYQQDGAGGVTFTAAGGVTLRVPVNYQAQTAGQYAVVQVFKTGTDTWVILGNLLSA